MAVGYLKLKEDGLLRERIEQAAAILKSCTLCPRQCGVDRTAGETGFCSAGSHARVASYAPHFGEEPQLVGTHGSGTVFFSHCNLKCCFCQNYDISIQGTGIDAAPGQLASVMLELQDRGCHNINLVTPTHVVPQFLEELDRAADHGLNLPIVYNTSGYDRVPVLKLLDGIVDIYMPDIKFFDPDLAEQACQAADYPDAVRAAVKEMHRQVGDLVVDEKGVAVRGLLVRHLVLPEDMAGTEAVMAFIKDEISPDTYINVMSQYRPAGDAHKVRRLARAVTPDEFRAALQTAQSYGLKLVR